MLNRYKFYINKIVFVVFIILFSLESTAQKYPQNSFRLPVSIPISLSGNFGEIRSGHLHAGLDIRVGGVVGLPLLAVADGYISRVKVAPWGYGNMVYVTFSNGYTAIYGHLLSFRDDLQVYLYKEMYRRKKFEINLFLKPHQFEVKKGDIVGYAGNTGSSFGAHLHFEIRDSKTDWYINPLLFGFKIKDTKRPIINTIKIYPLTKDSEIELTYKNGRKKLFYDFRSVTLSTVFKKDTYQLYNVKKILAKGNIGFSIESKDYIDNSPFRIGPYDIKLFVEKKIVFHEQFNTWGKANTKSVNVHIDFAEKSKKKRIYQRSFVLEGNNLPIYKKLINNGIIHIKKGKQYNIKYVVSDFSKNEACLPFKIEYLEESDIEKKDKKKAKYHIQKINPTNNSSKPYEDKFIKKHHKVPNKYKDIYVVKGDKNLDKHYFDTQTEPTSDSVFNFGMYDLKGETEYIDSSIKGYKSMFFDYKKQNYYENKNIKLTVPNYSLYENTNFLYRQRQTDFGFSNQHCLHKYGVPPLNKLYTVSIKLDKNVPQKMKDKLVIVAATSKGEIWGCLGGNYKDGWISAKTAYWGWFHVDVDTMSPIVKAFNFSKKKKYYNKKEKIYDFTNFKKIVFTAKDKLSGIKSYKAEIDGNWVILEYDYKTHQFIYRFENNVSYYDTHKFEIQITDNKNNTIKYLLNFKKDYKMKLEEGKKAPDFELENQDGQKISLKDYEGKKVVLYFYPKDNTSGCTVEAKNLKENFKDLEDEGYVILGVSPDNVASHKKFHTKLELPFHLLADPEKQVLEDYGVWGEKRMYGRIYMGVYRTTFLIDEQGNIERIIKKVKTKEHSSQIMNK